MRVLYDGEKFVTQTAGGISAYFSKLISNLPDDIHPTIGVRRSRSLHLPRGPRIKVVQPPQLGLPRLTRVAERAVFATVMALGRFDVVHPTYYETIMVGDVGRFRGPLVLTVHDLVHEIFRAQIDPKGRHAAIKRRAIEHADSLICVSQNTRKDLLEIYGVPEDRVSVIHEAAVIEGVPANAPQDRRPSPYFLYVGSRDAAYKNFFLAVDGLAALAPNAPQLKLLVVGSPWEDLERRYIAEKQIGDRIEHLGHVSADQLAVLYRDSVALLYPSRYEGFGIPPLEAMACGSVVIASAVASLPEVVGDAGILIDPSRPDDFIEAMRTMLTDASARGRLVDKGRERIRQFSWKRAAEQTAAIYRQLV